MKQIFFIPGHLPGFNEILAAANKGGRTRSGRRLPGIAYNEMKKHWTLIISERILIDGCRPMESCFLDCLWIEKNRRRDPDNIRAATKFIWDGLVKARILKNDGWKQNLGERHRYKVGRPCGVIVTLTNKIE